MNDLLNDEVVITLTGDEYQRLLLLTGYATGAAMKDDPKLAYSFLDLANRINRDNPRWTPYAIPEEYRPN
jgi:hypothetical protein